MTESETHWRYLVLFAFFAALCNAFVAAGNIIVDPYFMFGSPGRPGFNAIRVEAINHPLMVRAYSLNNQTPRSLIFGSSRAQIGLNPEHPGFQGRPVYNTGIPGTSMHVMLRYFQHALAVSRPQQVVLALDFFQFDMRDPSGAATERLAVTLNGQPTPMIAHLRQRMLDLGFAALSTSAVAASWRTIAENNGLNQTMKWVTLENGQSVLINRPPSFAPAPASYAAERSFLRNIWSPRFCTVSPETGANQFDTFRQFVRLAHKQGTDLRIFISPAHARMWENIAQAGLWEKWERWKSQLTSIVVEEAGSKSPFPLWDFSGYNFMTTDSLQTARFYVEPNHYTSEAGDLVLDVLFGRPDSRGEIIGEFGVRLNNETIDSHLARIRADRERWRTAFPAHVAQIKALADEIPEIRTNNASCE